jgi:NAD(P)H dehydrogenase (quinone)
MAEQKRIFIVFYSMYGHIKRLAEEIRDGAAESENISVELYYIPETLSQDVLDKMGAPPKDESIPVMEDVSLMTEADGIIFGIPTRFGSMSAQFSAFWDQTGGLWMSGGLVGKPVAMFTSTGSLGGGQETTLLTTITKFVHHGMIYVPIGYTSPLLTDNSEPRGGSPYGSGTITNADGSRMPSENELALAKHQGQYFASVVSRFS